MSSDKGKGVASGTRRKTRASANSSLKQKTLLDAFIVRRPQESSQLAKVEDAINAVEIQSLQSEPPATTEPLSSAISVTIPDAMEVITVEDTPEPPVQYVNNLLHEAPNDNDMPLVVHHTDKSSAEPRERSPSIIVIDDGAAKAPPVSKPVFPIAPSNTSTALKQEGHTPDLPIIIDSSPIRARATTSKLNKPIHPFFGARPKATNSINVRPPSKTPTNQTLCMPLYPDGASQHVKGTQTPYQPGQSHIWPARILDPPRKDTEATVCGFLESVKGKLPEKVTERPTYLMSENIDGSTLSNIPPEYKVNHPAIARLLDHRKEDSFESRRPWSEKWRPTCAQEVLGNEQSAIYLRNWLRALELQLEDPNRTFDAHPGKEAATKAKAAKRGQKRTRVVRAVDKKRKKSRMDSDEDDDWIVEDDSEDERVTYEALDEFDEFYLAPPQSSSPASHHEPQASSPSSLQGPVKKAKEPDLGQLHNTILLVGPHGSGKTASVYACAEELGWEVFEVYPGIGRRNGANVDNLVGEVGKNHLVLPNRQSGDSLKSFLRPKNQSSDSTTAAEDARPSYSPRKPSTFKTTFEEEEEPIKNATQVVRQSLILLEEVDILFKEDSNFWSTVIRIIKECKRPVICTCNDISLVPLEELPLQSVLYFGACPPNVAVPYLQGLCAAEGRPVQQEMVSTLYMTPSPEFLVSGPNWDLRRNINALQVLCTTANSIDLSGPCPPGENINETNNGRASPQSSRTESRIVERSEIFSFLDGVLDLDFSMITEFAGYMPSEDDEIGHSILHDLYIEEEAQLGQYDRHGDILRSATRLNLFDVGVTADALATQPFEGKTTTVEQDYQRVLQELCPIGIWARPDCGGVLDYIPLVRQMVAAEDAEEAREMEKRRGVGRSTRNSARSGYGRLIGITEEGRSALERSVLGM